MCSYRYIVIYVGALSFLCAYWKVEFKGLNQVAFSTGMVHGGFQWKQKREKESPFSIIHFIN